MLENYWGVFFQACHHLKRMFNLIKHTICPKVIKKGKTRENPYLCLYPGLHCPSSILLVNPRFERDLSVIVDFFLGSHLSVTYMLLVSANHGNRNVLGGQLLSLLLHVPHNNRGKKNQLLTLIPKPTKREKGTLSLYDASIFF